MKVSVDAVLYAASLKPYAVFYDTFNKKVEEHADLLELLAVGEGVAEDKTLRLVIGRTLLCCACRMETESSFADDYFHVHHEHHAPEYHTHFPISHPHCGF